jgi:CDP-2,3-bis-(O-geranylgeranyl)-sn-glycerol synthase
MPDWPLILATLLLVLCANAAPAMVGLVVRVLPARRRMPPLDGGRYLGDGRPALGASKTWPGLAAALVATPICAMMLGWPWLTGLGVGAAAMTGDLIASLIKRRLGLPSGSSAPLLDEVPESLLPALLLGLRWIDIAVVVTAFVAIDRLLTSLSKLFASKL